MKKTFCYLCLFLLILTCSSCDLLTQLTCKHSYEITQMNPSTCTFRGTKLETCSLCGWEKKTILDLLPHSDSVDVVDPTCTEKGYTVSTCSVCGRVAKDKYVDELGHNYNDWETTVSPTDFSDGLKERTCKNCGNLESEIIISNSYVDLSIIRTEFDNSNTIECDNYEELSLMFNCAVFNLEETLTCELKYGGIDFYSLLEKLVDDCDIPCSFAVNAQLMYKNITFSFKYNEIASQTTNKLYYNQYGSLNYHPITPSRDDTYDDFEIEDSVYSYEVNDSEQLYYVLERGVKPICVPSSKADIIYKEIKAVLREIINDDMNSLEKVKAIHDYLVMNITYDEELLQYAYNNSSDLKSYNGFYLEGVFIDKKAVCEGFSKAFTAMCNIEGIPCVSVVGYQTLNPNGVGHAWNKVYVNDSWYIVDVTSDGPIIDKKMECLSYKYFLIDEDSYKVKYTGNTYKDIICNKRIDIYSMESFEYNDKTYDFIIDSQDEFAVIVLYFHKNAKDNSTISFKINFDCGSSAYDEFNKALAQSSIYTRYSFIEDVNEFIIVK